MDLLEPLKAALSPSNDPPLLRLLGLTSDRQAPEPISIDHPLLAALAQRLDDEQQAAEIYDEHFRLLWCSTEQRGMFDDSSPEKIGIGEHALALKEKAVWQDLVTEETWLTITREMMPYIKHHSEAHQLRDVEDEQIRELLDETDAIPAPPLLIRSFDIHQSFGDVDLPPLGIQCHTMRLHDAESKLIGFCSVYSPNMRAGLLALVARGDSDMFERMSDLFVPGPRAVALLFCDLESSTALSRSMSSAAYFTLLSRFSRNVDDAIIAQGGIVGKHVGDGVSAYFVRDQFGSEGECAQAAFRAALEIRRLTSGLSAEIAATTGADMDLRVNIGLHWGGALYMGQIVTGGASRGHRVRRSGQ